jgi:cytochrome b6
MIVALFLHFFSVLFVRAYRQPRELTWFSGFVLLALALAFGFTGYLLPWNELAYFATRVGTEILAVVPLVGEFLLRVARGGEDVSGATLTRFYAVHVAVLPAVAIGMLGLHLFLVQKHGMSVPIEEEGSGAPRRAMPFFPNFFLRDLVGWLAALAILAALAAYFPAPLAILAALAAYFPAHLGEKADPFAPAPAGIKPEWYFMYMFQTLKYLPAHILGLEGEFVGIFGFAVGGLLVFLIPFLDWKARRGESSKVVTWVTLGLIVYIVILTYLGYTADPTQ